MSNVAIVAFNGFVGFGGASVRLVAGDEWNLDDPQSRAFYEANPDKFASPTPEPEPVQPKKFGRAVPAKAQPKAGRDG